MAKSLRQRTLNGIFWTSGSQIGTQFLQFLLFVILGWLLTPDDFGLIGMMLVFTGFVQLFNELGFGAALVQAKEIEERHRSSVFYLNLVFGFVTSIVVFALAPLLSWFFQKPELTVLTQWMSLNFIFGGVVVVQRALLMRKMDFRKLAIVELISLFLAGTISICMAWNGYGVLSLVFMYLVQTLVISILLWGLSDWRPKLVWSFDAVKELLGFSSNLMGGNVLNYWIRNADNLLIGRVAGSDALGFYTRAYTTMLLPVRQISRVLGRVMFPAMSKIKDDPVRVKQLYLKTIQTISLFSFPAMLGLMVVAPEFVLAIFGPQWTKTTPLLQVLCLVGLAQSINGTVGWIYQSQGRTDIFFIWIIVTAVLTFICFGIGIFWGAMGVAVAYTIRVYGTIYWNFAVPGKIIGMTFSDVLLHVGPQLLLAITMASVVLLVSFAMPDLSFAMPDHWHTITRLAIEVLAGASVYVALVLLIRPRSYQQVVELIAQQLRARRTEMSAG